MSISNSLLWIILIISIIGVGSSAFLAWWIYGKYRESVEERIDNPDLLFSFIPEITGGYAVGEAIPCDSEIVENRRIIKMLPKDVNENSKSQVRIQEFPMDTRKMFTAPRGFPSKYRNLIYCLPKDVDDFPESFVENNPLGKALQKITSDANVKIETTNLMHKAIKTISEINSKHPLNNPMKGYLNMIEDIVFNAKRINEGEIKNSRKIKPVKVKIEED